MKHETKKPFQFPIPPNHKVYCDGVEVKDLGIASENKRYPIESDLLNNGWTIEGKAWELSSSPDDLYLIEEPKAEQPEDDRCFCEDPLHCPKCYPAAKPRKPWHGDTMGYEKLEEPKAETSPAKTEGEKPENRAFVNVYRQGFTRFLGLDYPTKEEALRDVDNDYTYLETVEIIRTK